MKLEIVFSDAVKLAEFEARLGDNYARSLRSEEVVFDLANTNWIGAFPSTILFAWALALRRDNTRKVKVVLPDRTKLSNQLVKGLLRSEVLARLAEAGVEVPYKFASESADGIPLKVLAPPAPSNDGVKVTKSEAHKRFVVDVGLALGKQLEADRATLRKASNIATHEEAVVEEAFSTVLFELGENAFLHTRSSRPHYLVNVATSSGPQQEYPSWEQGVVSVFPAGTRYVEIVLGDLGPGIDNVLAKHVPANYQPDGKLKRKLSKAERAVAYAFEFSSTSNRQAREVRVQSILSQESLDSAQIATGLFCVADVARRLNGQLLVRTPKALLSIDYTGPAAQAELKVRKASSIANLPGTHYWLRIPLSPLRSSVKSSEPEQKMLALSNPRILCLPSIPWLADDGRATEAAAVAGAIHDIDDSLSSATPNAPDLVALLPPLRSLTSRAEAVLVGAVHLFARQGHMIWPDENAARLFSPKLKALNGHSRTTVLFGDVLTNSFLTGNSLGQSDLASGANDPERISLPADVHRALCHGYFEKVHEVLVGCLASPAVRYSDGAFFFGSYYTDVFYEVRRALSLHFGFAELLAKWIARRFMSTGGSFPEVVLSSIPTLNELAERLVDCMRQLGHHDVTAVTPQRSVSAPWVIGQMLPHQGKRLLILTDVVCTARTIEGIVNAAAELSQTEVFTLVDARDDQKGGGPLYSQLLRRTVPMIALVKEPIVPHERPTASFPRNAHGEHRIYVVHPDTRSPTLYAQPLRPKIGLSEMISDVLPSSEALLSGHIEHEERHYSHFLQLHRLFSSLRPQLTAWVIDQVIAFFASVKPADEWHVRYLDEEDWLGWLPEIFSSMPLPPRSVDKVRLDSRDSLEGRVEEARRERHFVLVLPVSATGHTARRFIEWASRQRANKILVLVLVSRMEAIEFEFLSRITVYNDAVDLRVRHFLEFGLPSQASARRSCGLCLSQKEVERLAVASRERLGRNALLSRALLNKAERLQPIHASRLVGDDLRGPTPSDIERAQLALYLHARAKASPIDRPNVSLPLLGRGSDRIGHLLLRHISAESPTPGGAAYGSRGIDAELEHHAREAVFEVLLDSAPPYNLARVVPSLAQLNPVDFVEAAPSLLLRFASSIRDVEEVLLATLMLREWSDEFDTVAVTLAEDPDTAIAAELVKEAGILAAHLSSVSPLDSNESFVRSCCELHACLLRSSSFVGALNGLELYLEDGSWKEIQNQLRHLWAMWEKFGQDLVVSMGVGGRWDRFARGTRASGALRELRRAVARLTDLASSTPGREGLTEKELRSDVRDQRSRLDIRIVEVVEFLWDHFGGPSHLAICERQAGEYTTFNGDGKYNFVSEVDSTIGLAFYNTPALDDVCGAIIDNWTRNKELKSMSGNAAFRLYREAHSVVLEFADDFPGELPQDSLGGLHTIDLYCQTFAAELERVPRNAAGVKALRLKLPLLPRDVRRV